MNDAAQVIRRYSAIARRRWMMIAQATIVVGVAAALFAVRSEDTPFQSKVTMLVRDDSSTSDRWKAADLLLDRRNSDVYGDAVLAAAAAAVPGETPASVRAAVSSQVNKTAGTITITVTAPEASRPTPIATALTTAYVADQRGKVTEALRKSLSETEAQAASLETSLAQLDRGNQPTGVSPSIPPPGVVATTTTVVTSDKAKRDSLVAQLSTVYTSAETIKRQITTADPGVEVLFPASGAARAPSSSPVKRGVQGAAAGLLVGVALAGAREVLDTRLGDREQVEEAFPWPLLAEMVTVDTASSSPLAAHDNPTGAIAETMRGLRTSIRFIDGDEPVRSIVVTSAQPGDGKTFLAANLAVSYAQLGLRTVLVSGDMRRPTLDSYFHAKTTLGLSDALAALEAEDSGAFGLEADDPSERVLSREALPLVKLDEFVRFTGIPNLWLLPAGAVPHNPAELLASESATKLFSRLAQSAEMVVIDSPPLVVVDAVLLGRLASGVLVVASVASTERAAAQHARERLEGSHERVVGLVLNRVKPTKSSYGYYSTYGEEAPPARRRPWQRGRAA